MIDLDNLERTLELANDYVDDGLHFLTEPVSYGELKLLAERLISAEKDAARYKNEVEAAKFDIGNLSSKLERADSVIFEVERVLSERQKNGSFDCDDLLSEAQYYIDNHQGIKE